MLQHKFLLGCLLVVFTLHAGCEGYIEKPGPRFPPTKGFVWPKPQSQNSSITQFTVNPRNFQFKVLGSNTCIILTEAIQRYNALLMKQSSRHPHHHDGNQESALPTLPSINVYLSSPCEQWPSLDMDEEYYLEVNEVSSQIASKSIWGILRGLETFSQLLYRESDGEKNLLINATNIHDFARFPHRGILLDTSRHYISLHKIFALLDGMVYNKLNVFHWHIVDDQSFPYVSKVYPNVSELGAYHPMLVYTQSDVSQVVEYARVRGIRVLPEFDTPGHTRSWGVAFPKLLTECYKNGKPNGDLGPMNPAEPFVYTFMETLLAEITQHFPDKYVHLGGDEVDFDCWESNPDVNAFMKNHNITKYAKLEEVYIQRIVDMVEKLNSKSVVWQEVFLNGVQLQKGTVVQVWTGDQAALLSLVTSNGLEALLSTCWYLDHLSTGGDWKKFYECEPLDFSGTDAQKKLVKGGEACMWAEVVDDNNILSRIFPRASATAEKLWSAKAVGGDNLNNRLEEQYCRLNRRGIPAQPPSGPGFCAL